MNDTPHNAQDPQTLMDELSFLRETLETVQREKQKLYEEFLREQKLREETLNRIYNSKSWRWTAPIRELERALRGRGERRIPYRILAHAKKLWMEVGSPCPRLARFCRHRILGHIWPARTETAV